MALWVILHVVAPKRRRRRWQILRSRAAAPNGAFGHFSVSASNREGLSVRVLWREPLQIVGKARRQEAVLGGEDRRASQA
jgi:hypothetical protein